MKINAKAWDRAGNNRISADVIIHIEMSYGCNYAASATESAYSGATEGTSTETSSSSYSESGTTYSLLANLTGSKANLNPVERTNRIIPAEFETAIFNSQLTWRIVVKDWSIGNAGQVTYFSVRLEETSDAGNPDTDADTLGDGLEVNSYGTFPVTKDTEGDGLSDDFEVKPYSVEVTVDGRTNTISGSTDPLRYDTDGDNISDGEEYNPGIDRVRTNPFGIDTDMDSLKDGDEEFTYYSNATLTDTDMDGMSDSYEVTQRTIWLPINGTPTSRTITTLPYSDDTDADGVKDPDEVEGILGQHVLYYDMSTTTDVTHLRDLSGNGNTGTMFETSSGMVKVGGARDFDGVNDKVSATLPGLSGFSSWSFSIWFKWDNGVATTWQHPIGFGQGHDATLYIHKPSLTLYLKVTNALGNVVVEQALQTFTSSTAKASHHAAVTFDGVTLQAYVDGVAKGPWSASILRIRTDALRIGTSAYESGNYFDGKIDEVQVWDRALTPREVTGYYNVTNVATSIVAWLDMETRTSTGDLFDFGGNGHPGIATGTTIVDGRSGLARSFAGGSDGVVLSGTGGISFSSGASISLYILLSSYPAADTSLVSRKDSFYLNLTSGGLVAWSMYKGSSIVTPLPVALNRWVRVSATAGSSGLAIYFDGLQMASGSGTVPPSSATSVVVGYAEGLAHFVGAVDDVLVLSTVATSWTILDLGSRGIVLNPNATDTDFDGLTDGQELFLKIFKAPKRYPIQDLSTAMTDYFAVNSGTTAMYIVSAEAMVGITHTYIGDLRVILGNVAGGTDESVTVRNHEGGFADNNFTSYNLLSYASFTKDDFTTSRSWYLKALDEVGGDRGQIEYFEIHLAIRTAPNHADYDGDTLNDSEELTLGKDGFLTDPWNRDTDGDSLSDDEYSTKGTDPTRGDTDRDKVSDAQDIYPLGDAFITVRLDDIGIGGSDDQGGLPEPFFEIEILGNKSVSDYAAYGSGYFKHYFSINIPDDQQQVQIKIRAWDYDTDNTHEPISVAAYWSGSSCTPLYEATFTYSYVKVGNEYSYWAYGCIQAYAYTNPLWFTVISTAVTKKPVSLISPLDYSSLYNITDAGGNILDRRYLGEDRFVLIQANNILEKRDYSLVFDMETVGPSGRLWDLSGNANHGGINGALDSGGYGGRALRFDGQNDYIAVPDSPSISPTQGITVAFWVKANLDGSTNVMSGLRKEDAYILQWRENGAIRPHVYVGGGWQVRETSASVLPSNVWTHLMMTYDSSARELRLYVNWDKGYAWQFSGLSSYTISDSDSRLTIGKADCCGEYVEGILDSVRIYSRALSPDERWYMSMDMGTVSLALDMESLDEYYPSYQPLFTRFDDLSGNGNYGTISGPVDVDGRFGRAREFDGYNDYIEASNSQSLNPDTFTISLWIKPLATVSDWAQILRKGEGSDDLGTRAPGLWFWPGSTKLHFAISIGPGSQATPLDSVSSLPLNQWSYVAISYDRQNMKIWINGKVDNQRPETSTMYPNSESFKIGRKSQYISPNAIIDEVMVFNRPLSSDEIMALVQFSYGLNQFLVPRSIFYDSQLYVKLNSSFTGYNFKDFQYTDYSKDRTNSDAIQAVLTINSTYSGLKQLLNLMLYNSSGGKAYDIVDIADYLYLADLPDDAVKIVAYNTLVNTPSTIYTFSDGSSNQRSLIEKLWLGFVTVITTSLNYIYSGLVATWNFLVEVAKVLEQIGGWIWYNVVTTANTVKQAAEAAGKAFVQMVDALADGILAVVHAALDPLLKLVTDAYNAWANEVAQLILSIRSLSVNDFVRGLIQATFFSVFALAIFAIIVAISVAEKITNAMTLGLANVAGIVIGAIGGLIIGMLVVAVVNEWLGSIVIEELLPPGFDDVTGATFTVAQFLFAYELAQRPLKPVQGVETALKDSILGLMILGVSLAIKATVGETVFGLTLLVVADVIALYLALSGVKDMIKISGRGANLVMMWYPFLYPVTVAMNAIGIATTATDLVSDAGKLNNALAGGG